MAKKAWLAGTIFLALAVLIGAFGAHGLKNLVTPEKLVTFETGVRYHFYHAFGVLFLAAFAQLNPTKKIGLSFSAFTVGILLFSFNCYLYALTEIKTFAMIVPVGGTLFVLGWLAFAKTILARDPGTQSRDVF
jgi:uncharacterized membrane protein YgdD (TMEM256/DUF423 family)